MQVATETPFKRRESKCAGAAGGTGTRLQIFRKGRGRYIPRGWTTTPVPRQCTSGMAAGPRGLRLAAGQGPRRPGPGTPHRAACSAALALRSRRRPGPERRPPLRSLHPRRAPRLPPHSDEKDNLLPSRRSPWPTSPPTPQPPQITQPFSATLGLPESSASGATAQAPEVNSKPFGRASRAEEATNPQGPRGKSE